MMSNWGWIPKVCRDCGKTGLLNSHAQCIPCATNIFSDDDRIHSNESNTSKSHTNPPNPLPRSTVGRVTETLSGSTSFKPCNDENSKFQTQEEAVTSPATIALAQALISIHATLDQLKRLDAGELEEEKHLDVNNTFLKQYNRLLAI
jgi:hypothetical protein